MKKYSKNIGHRLKMIEMEIAIQNELLRPISKVALLLIGHKDEMMKKKKPKKRKTPVK